MINLFKEKLFLIGSILVVIFGVIAIAVGFVTDIGDEILVMSGFLVLFLGIILLISSQVWSSIAESKEAQVLSYLIVLGSMVGILAAFGGLIFEEETALYVALGGAVLVLIGFLMWPCICCQNQGKASSKVIGVARSHTSVSIAEISQITGIPHDEVKAILYEALSERQLVGTMEGETFTQSAPRTTSPTTTATTHRETVKVLVICPYCGAKTEQGLTKCSNCQADL